MERDERLSEHGRRPAESGGQPRSREVGLQRALAGARPHGLGEQAAAAATRVAERAAAERLADVAYATLDSPLGPLLVAGTARGLVRLAYAASDEEAERILNQLALRLSPRIVRAPRRLEAVRRELDEYFAARRRAFALAVDWRLVAGPFARRLLQATARIPFGATAGYAELAAAVGSPRAARAAGNALAANPIPIVVPCHRVLHSGGRIGGYTGGLERKRALLALEGVVLG